MPDYFTTGFMVREPAWHGLGVVLDEFPGRAEGIPLAGHNFVIRETEVYKRTIAIPKLTLDTFAEHGGAVQTADGVFGIGVEDAYKILRKEITDPFVDLTPEQIEFVKSQSELFGQDILMPGSETDRMTMHIPNSTYGIVQNEIGWDIAEALIGEGIKFETAGTLKDGGVCWILAYLDEPYTVPGDDTQLLPYVNISWSHDGSGAVKVRPTSIRVVCWNTQSAAEAQGQRNNQEYTFRHTKNVMEHIEDAKESMMGLITETHQTMIEFSQELAKINVTEEQRKLFIEQIVPAPPEYLTSDRVRKNIDNARTSLSLLFEETNPSIADEHRLTGWGLWCAGTEYLDHLRGARNSDTMFGRQLLRNEPLKAKLADTIREVAKA